MCPKVAWRPRVEHFVFDAGHDDAEGRLVALGGGQERGDQRRPHESVARHVGHMTEESGRVVTAIEEVCLRVGDVFVPVFLQGREGRWGHKGHLRPGRLTLLHPRIRVHDILRGPGGVLLEAVEHLVGDDRQLHLGRLIGELRQIDVAVARVYVDLFNDRDVPLAVGAVSGRGSPCRACEGAEDEYEVAHPQATGHGADGRVRPLVHRTEVGVERRGGQRGGSGERGLAERGVGDRRGVAGRVRGPLGKWGKFRRCVESPDVADVIALHEQIVEHLLLRRCELVVVTGGKRICVRAGHHRGDVTARHGHTRQRLNLQREQLRRALERQFVAHDLCDQAIVSRLGRSRGRRGSERGDRVDGHRGHGNRRAGRVAPEFARARGRGHRQDECDSYPGSARIPTRPGCLRVQAWCLAHGGSERRSAEGDPRLAPAFRSGLRLFEDCNPKAPPA